MLQESIFSKLSPSVDGGDPELTVPLIETRLEYEGGSESSMVEPSRAEKDSSVGVGTSEPRRERFETALRDVCDALKCLGMGDPPIYSSSLGLTRASLIVFILRCSSVKDRGELGTC